MSYFSGFILTFVVFSIFHVNVSLSYKTSVIFLFGDSNSDTGGASALYGSVDHYPQGRIFPYIPSGRASDGRLIIDFLCENLNTTYLTPYLYSFDSNYKNGCNFAISGASINNSNTFRMLQQYYQFIRFHNLSVELHAKGHMNLLAEEEFKSAVYMIDIGQNDLSLASLNHIYSEVVAETIPAMILDIKRHITNIYRISGRKFWVHGTGPLGCLPQKLATTKSNATDYDEYGCLKYMNEMSQTYNQQLKLLLQQLRVELTGFEFVYVDLYSIKYNIIANASSYGFNSPLMACCGQGGGPYNYNNLIGCGGNGYEVCSEESRYISWDGIHYTEAANAIVSAKILSTNYSDPPIQFDLFCSS